MHVAYEHIRLVPSNDLAKQITESYLKDEIADVDHQGVQSLESLEGSETNDIYEDIFGTNSYMEEIEELQPIETSTTLM